MSRMRLLVVFCLLLGCAPFDADRGAYSARVTGDIDQFLEGSAYYPSTVSDEPPQTVLLLTDTGEPLLRFVFDVASVETRTYPVGEVRITYEPDDINEAHFVADSGSVTFDVIEETTASGSFSFEATNGTSRIAVAGTFDAEL